MRHHAKIAVILLTLAAIAPLSVSVAHAASGHAGPPAMRLAQADDPGPPPPPAPPPPPPPEDADNATIAQYDAEMDRYDAAIDAYDQQLEEYDEAHPTNPG